MDYTLLINRCWTFPDGFRVWGGECFFDDQNNPYEKKRTKTTGSVVDVEISEDMRPRESTPNTLFKPKVGLKSWQTDLLLITNRKYRTKLEQLFG